MAFSDDPDAIEAASDSVIKLNCYAKDGSLYASGSAFAALDQGIFVTNYHVIEGDVYSVKGQRESDSEFVIRKIIAYSSEQDIAILQADAKDSEEIQVLSLGDTSSMRKGEKVTTIGSPLGLMNTVSTGVFSGTVMEDGMDYLQFSAAISHGSSGGALFNEQGEVIGITSASYSEGQNLNLAVPSERITELWDRRSSMKSLTMQELYESIDHTLVCDPDYIFAHCGEFDNDTVKVCGYISSIDFGNDAEGRSPIVYLVSAPEDVLGYVFAKNAEWDYSGNNRQGQEPMRVVNGECLQLYIGLIALSNVDTFSPGDYVQATCFINIEKRDGLFWQGTKCYKLEAA